MTCSLKNEEGDEGLGGAGDAGDAGDGERWCLEEGFLKRRGLEEGRRFL